MQPTSAPNSRRGFAVRSVLRMTGRDFPVTERPVPVPVPDGCVLEVAHALAPPAALGVHEIESDLTANGLCGDLDGVAHTSAVQGVRIRRT